MDNDQILWWIAQNNEVYLKGILEAQTKKLAETDKMALREDSPILLKTVVSKYFNVLKELLLQGKAVSLSDEVIFFTCKVNNLKEKTVQIKPQHFLFGKLKRLVACSPKYHQQAQLIKQMVTFRQVCQATGSLLLIDSKFVQSIMSAFMRASCDLLLSGKQVRLCLPFCNLKLSQTRSQCTFSENFILELNKPRLYRQARSLYLNRFRCKFQAEEFSRESRFYSACWEQIKEGNQFDRPSLKEIQGHLEKGYQLELKYKSQFQ